jgi:hypothetical protein
MWSEMLQIQLNEVVFPFWESCSTLQGCVDYAKRARWNNPNALEDCAYALVWTGDVSGALAVLDEVVSRESPVRSAEWYQRLIGRANEMARSLRDGDVACAREVVAQHIAENQARLSVLGKQ